MGIIIFSSIIIIFIIRYFNKYKGYGVDPRTGKTIYLNDNLSNNILNNNRYNDWEVQKLFTNQELEFYKKLLIYLKNKDVFLLSKVRIADLVKPKIKLNNSDFMKVFLKLSQKHIDYVITDLDGNILLLIELDGDSHNLKKIIKSDIFKNDFFDVLNIPLMRFKNYTNFDFSKLEKYFKI